MFEKKAGKIPAGKKNSSGNDLAEKRPSGEKNPTRKRPSGSKSAGKNQRGKDLAPLYDITKQKRLSLFYFKLNLKGKTKKRSLLMMQSMSVTNRPSSTMQLFPQPIVNTLVDTIVKSFFPDSFSIGIGHNVCILLQKN